MKEFFCGSRRMLTGFQFFTLSSLLFGVSFGLLRPKTLLFFSPKTFRISLVEEHVKSTVDSQKKLFPIVLRHLLFFSMLQQRATLSFLSPSSHMRLKTLDCCAIICQTLIWASCRFWEGRNEEFRRLSQFGWLQAQHGDEMSLRCWRVAFQK